MIGKHATNINSSNGITRVIYHNTNVVEFTSKQIVLRTGGFRTKTTKLRMNQASKQFNLGFFVFQRNFEWFVNYRGNLIPFTHDFLILDIF